MCLFLDFVLGFCLCLDFAIVLGFFVWCLGFFVVLGCFGVACGGFFWLGGWVCAFFLLFVSLVGGYWFIWGWGVGKFCRGGW